MVYQRWCLKAYRYTRQKPVAGESLSFLVAIAGLRFMMHLILHYILNANLGENVLT